ncbi:ABC transporter substrate-binding protein [Cohnella abietis]|uniref:ABC transporter substrate-binding protein n=1 Tax=Cohnella abietis TaxID=2507935 RepID=A0A3T1CZX1_9BACL|nr:ABC transporter substrate-binding protein [Cohnella abietis]BBI31417.1 ABC transporter substrate-binding protein [Cohnella abietis]
MKKTFAMILALIMMVSIVLAGCSKSGNNDSTANAGQSGDKPIKLVWWVHENPSFVDANKKMIEEYKKVKPNVTIDLQVFPYDAFIQKIRVSMNTNTAPDIVQMFGTWVREYAKNGLLEPSSNGAALEAEIYPAAIGGFQYEGKVYGAPHEFNIENGAALRYPKKFKEAGIEKDPSTWAELIEDAKKLTKRDGNKITVRGLDITSNDSVVFYFLSMIQQQGSDFWNEDQSQVRLTTPEAVKAMQELVDLVQVHKVTDLTKLGTPDEPYIVFYKGMSAMTTAGPWTIAEGQNTYNVQDFDYMPIPSYTDKPPVFSSESGWGEVVSSRSSNAQAAWEFVQFMTEDENASAWNLRTSSIPAKKKVAEDPKYLERAPMVKAVLDILPNGSWIGPLADRDYFFKAINDAYAQITYGKVNVQDGLKTAENDINKMLKAKQ